MQNKNKIQIWILTRDRLQYFKEALLSTLQQKTNKDYEVVVSDNSEDDKTFDYMRKNHPNIKYVRRFPSVSPESHFKLAIEESACDYLVIFHDDDILLPTYLEEASNILDEHANLSAVGTNASLIIKDKLTKIRIMGNFNKNRILAFPFELLRPYFHMNLEGAAAFPSYMYRKAAIRSDYGDNKNGGKYSDLTFLYQILKNGPIFWIKTPLINYRIHPTSDSATENIYHRLRLIRFFNVNEGLKSCTGAYSDYRFLYWKSWWRTTKNGALCIFPKGRKEKIVAKFLAMKMIELIFTRKILYQKFLNKLKN